MNSNNKNETEFKTQYEAKECELSTQSCRDINNQESKFKKVDVKGTIKVKSKEVKIEVKVISQCLFQTQ